MTSPPRKLYGRDDLVDRIGRSEAALLLLTGDSGIGKSEVLTAATGRREGWLHASPRVLAQSVGALQHGVLDGLADVVVQIASDHSDLAELRDRVLRLTRNALTAILQDLAKAVGAELISLVRGRLGPEFGQALESVIRSLREDTNETLTSRLHEAIDESMAETLAAFAAEVVAFAGTRRVSLSLDSAERLMTDERRLLGDLAERLPNRCHLRVAFATDVQNRREAVAELKALCSRAFEIEIPPLDQPAIDEWLQAEGVSRVGSDAVAKATGAYPLYVGDLVRHLAQGGTPSDAPINQQARERMLLAWQQLPPAAAVAARSLCVLPDPLPEEHLLQLTGLTQAEYGHVVEKLEWARFFPLRVNGQPWFHEQKRQFALEQLSESERDGVHTRGAEAIWQEVDSLGDLKYVDLFTQLAQESRTLQEQEPRLAAALSLPEEQLAVAAAMLELTLPQRDGATDGQELLRHARLFTDLELTPDTALRGLQDAGLLVFASNDYATIALPSWTSRAAAVIHGRARRELRRAPIPQVTQLAYQLALGPLLGEFDVLQFGVGRPSIASLSAMTAVDAQPPHQASSLRRRQFAHSLLVRARLDARPMFAAARYPSEETRDAAVLATTGAKVKVLGEELEVIEVISHPLQPVPALRFAQAAERAFRPPPSLSLTSGEIRVKLDEPLPYERAIELRIAAAQLLRSRASKLERWAMELDETYAIHWDVHDDVWIECTVLGGVERSVHVPGIASKPLDPIFGFFVLEQTAELEEHAIIQRVSQGVGIRTDVDPVLLEIGSRKLHMKEFNLAQPRLPLVLEEATLEVLVREGFLRSLEDARALQEIAVKEPEEIPPTALYVVVVLETPTQGWVAGAGASVTAIERRSDSGRDEVHFRLVQGETDLSGIFPMAVPHSEALFSDLFDFEGDLDGSGALRSIRCGIDGLMERYAGYARDDVELRWPGAIPPPPMIVVDDQPASDPQ